MEESVKTMASDESDDGYDPHHAYAHHNQAAQGHPPSRLSICSSSFTCSNDEDGDCNDVFHGDMEAYVSKLSTESFDADEELSDDEKTVPTSDSDRERDCFSLPETPPRRRSRGLRPGKKDCVSENEAGAQREAAKPRKSARRRTARVSRAGRRDDNYWNGMNGEEVKAYRDLGFELGQLRILEVPSVLSVSGSKSNLDTNSSGGSSPIANWRISSPGDDPRDVKARLKVWAQAVALISQTAHHSN